MTTPTEGSEPAEAGPAESKAPARASKRNKQQTQPAGLRVEHSAHGRTRARLSKEHRTPEKIAAIREELEKHPDVQNVEIDERTGSVLITHDEDRQGHTVMKEAFEDVEMLAGLLFEVPVGDGKDEAGGGEYGKLDQRLADIVSRVDEWQARRTGIHGGGAVVSGAVAGLGIAQIAIYGISLEMLPGPLLLYIAYDIHRRVKQEERMREGRSKTVEKQQDDPAETPGKDLRPAAA